MSARHPRMQLSEAGLVPKHDFGQNFLCEPSLCERIAEHAAPTGTRTVIEIGAGLGALTALLVERCERVVAIERDRDLVPLIATAFGSAVDRGGLEIVEADAKEFDYARAFSSLPRPACLAGNLPYQITGPLLRRSLEVASQIERCTFLVQLEVADRLTAAAATDAYGALSVFVQACYSVRRAFIVRRGAFFPQPKVDSALVVLVPHAQPIAEETPLFRALVKGAFAQRRKKLRNAWSGVAELSADGLAGAAALAGIDLNLRGEVLTVVQFAEMARAVSQLATRGSA